jgi:phosphoribosylformylglycinamidine synthase subunit PurQ / glutaminase
MIARAEAPFCVLKVQGTNCDRETEYAIKAANALEKAHAKPRIVLLNELLSGEQSLLDFRGHVLPGGFGYGDHGGGAGRVLAVNLTEKLRDQLEEIRARGYPLLGICNGFQASSFSGIVPFGKLGETRVALDQNVSGKFECRQTRLKIEEKHGCIWLQGMSGEQVIFQSAHGEGNFTTDPVTLSRIEKNHQVVFRYCDAIGNPTQEYPDNPNGSINEIAGITDQSGTVLCLMPHPERATENTLLPNWRRGLEIPARGQEIFNSMVHYAKQM